MELLLGMDVAFGQCHQWLLRLSFISTAACTGLELRLCARFSWPYISGDGVKTWSCHPEAMLIYIVWGYLWFPSPSLTCQGLSFDSIFFGLKMLLSNTLEWHKCISLMKNAVFRVFSNSFSRGRIPGFLSYMFWSVCIWGKDWGLYPWFLRALLGFLYNPFYMQHFRTIVLRDGLETAARDRF